MADLAQTVTNSINVFGASPTNKWGTMEWGDLWGASEDLATSFEKGISAGSLTLFDFSYRNITITTGNSVSFSADLDICKKYEKWCLVWTGPTANGADAVYDEFTKIGS